MRSACRAVVARTVIDAPAIGPTPGGAHVPTDSITVGTAASADATPPVAGQAILEANLQALAIRSPRIAELIRRAPPRPGLTWFKTEQDGAWSAELDGRALASKRRPLDEAKQQAAAIDFRQASGIVVLGFGLGYHVAEIARRGGDKTAIIVFEPDVPLLRAVLEHADLTHILRAGLIFFFTDPDDGAAVNESLAGLEGLLAVGIDVVEHAPSRARIAGTGARFSATITRFAASMRMQIVTTMMNMETTLRNLLMNLDEYAGGAGIAELRDFAAGRPAIVVSAGPSLARNIALLEDPAIRERVVIIAVQTVLKPLLARGIRPHFVTALDFHEISTRFYDGLTEDDVRGITLIAEPKANPAILQAFPGSIRLTRSDWLDWLIGDDLTHDKGEVPPGATVAHLAYLFARHLGCDPVMLIGQDLAFTDGQYYAAGAAIHDVWATELGEFNTLETMEWQRIVRWRGHLHQVQDHLGRPVYTDDQMSAYLAQFERLFLTDAEQGRTTIDATEGGAMKAYTTALPLRAALDRYASDLAPPVPGFPQPPRAGEPSPALKARIKSVREGVRAVARTCRETASILETMIEHHADQQRINRLIERVHDLQKSVKQNEPAYALVHRLNQAGAFKRFRADRELGLDADLPPLERQRKQIERDRMNVTWLGDSADALDELLASTLTMLDGGPRLTRDPAAPRQERSAADPPARTRIGALIIAAGPFDEAIAARAAARIATIPNLEATDIVNIGPLAAQASIRAARAFAPTCWRGGLGHLSCYDEFFEPAAIARAMQERSLDAALLIGADWALVDPALCAAVIERHRESPETLPLVFTQAPPGLCGIVISRRLCEDLASGRDAGDPMATIGGLLGFNPRRPALDPVAKACCVQIDGAIRGSPWRYIMDAAQRPWLDAALAGAHHESLSAIDIITRAEQHIARPGNTLTPRHLALTLGPGWDAAAARTELERFAHASPGNALTLRTTIDAPLIDLVRSAKSLGLIIHIRTEARCDESMIDALLAAGPDVISIDLHAVHRHTYTALTSGDMDIALRITERLLAARRIIGGLPHPWIAPRITRRDAVYEEIEGFYDRGLVFAAACVIDPLPAPIPGERIAPLPLPKAAARRDAALTRTLHLGAARA
jgi:hypothetical protein